MDRSVKRDRVRWRLGTLAGLVAVALAAVFWIAPVNVVFFTARDRSQRYSATGLPRDRDPDH